MVSDSRNHLTNPCTGRQTAAARDLRRYKYAGGKMTTVYCNNNHCVFQESDQCTRPHIILHNQGHAKVFWFSCTSYEKRIYNKSLNPDPQGPQPSRSG